MTCNARAATLGRFFNPAALSIRIFNPHITVIESQLRSFRYDFIYTLGIKGFFENCGQI